MKVVLLVCAALLGSEVNADEQHLRRGNRLLTNPVLPLQYIAYVGSNATFPLGRCEGDCDFDGHCTPFKCFSRSRREAVPGCSGDGASGIDYCYDPVDAPPTPPPTLAPTTTGAQTNPPTPQSQGGSSPPLVMAGDNGEPSTSFPLGHCEGDCDGDSQCDTGYVCYHRPDDRTVPGCSGTGVAGKDYCINASDAPPPSKRRLRLYWEYDFFWQNTHDEMWWCIETRGQIEIDHCHSGSTEWEFVFPATGTGAQIQERNTNKCMELVSSTEIAMKDCDASDSKQRWVALKGSFLGSKFDIRPVDDTDRCLSQHHHPKPHEEVYPETCDLAHAHDTGFWTLY